MQSKSCTLQEVKSILFESTMYKKTQNERNFKNKCNLYTNELFDEITDKLEVIRVSVSNGEHWFLLCYTIDRGVIIIDPTYSQNEVAHSNDHPFFIGTREELWTLAQDNDQTLGWFDKNWPTIGWVIGDFNENLGSKFNIDEFRKVKVGDQINIREIIESNDKSNLASNDAANQLLFFQPKKETKSHAQGKSFFSCFGKS